MHEGAVVGRHRGYPFYTIGQRRGLGAYGRRMYVTDIESESNRVHIGASEALLRRELVASQVNWSGIEGIDRPLRAQVKVRYKDEAAAATIAAESDGHVRVVFDQAKRAITPGQSVVFYDGDDLLGGAIIDRVL